MKLYTYWRSSASYRVRIALNLKGLDAEEAYVHLAKGEQADPAYGAINPQNFVPSLQLDDGTVLLQSLAILEYLEEAYPEPALLPEDAVARAHVRALAQMIAVDIHPLNNLRVLKYLLGPLDVDQTAKNTWYTHWIAEGFSAVEACLARDDQASPFLAGPAPGLFEVCLIPQMYNARRFGVDLSDFPRLRAIEGRSTDHPAFIKAAPEQQPDAT